MGGANGTRSGYDQNAEASVWKKRVEEARKSGYKKSYSHVGYREGDDLSKYELDLSSIRKPDESDEDFAKRMEEGFMREHDELKAGGADVGDFQMASGGPLKNPPPSAPDATDDLIKKARTAAWNRLQLGKTRQSSFATQGKLGGFDVAKPVLGGY